MLHITNGDGTRLRDTDIAGTVIFWRDVLHVMGDASFRDGYILPLLRCDHPLLSLVNGAGLRPGGLFEDPEQWAAKVEITDTGRAVLAGDLDHVVLNGIDRWFGGVHLAGREAVWRWDARHQRMVEKNV